MISQAVYRLGSAVRVMFHQEHLTEVAAWLPTSTEIERAYLFSGAVTTLSYAHQRVHVDCWIGPEHPLALELAGQQARLFVELGTPVTCADVQNGETYQDVLRLALRDDAPPIVRISAWLWAWHLAEHPEIEVLHADVEVTSAALYLRREITALTAIVPPIPPDPIVQAWAATNAAIHGDRPWPMRLLAAIGAAA